MWPPCCARLGDRVRYLHVKDGPVVDRDDFMTAVGTGRMPVAEILAASPSARWHVVELDRCATDIMTAVGDSLAWLTGQGLAQPTQPGPAPASSAQERCLMTALDGPVGVAVVGCGTISNEYLRNLTSFPDLRVLFCADLDLERAKEQAAKYGVPEAGTAAQALRRPDVELVVNLTIPAAHAEVTSAALAAGKSVWTEKPLALDTATGQRLVAEADRAGLRLGCAPDTVLGAGLQTAWRLMAEGVIGVPQTALTLMQNPGPERWHPDPEFLFQRGAGPLFDIGPYYLSVLAMTFGPAEQVAAAGHRSRDTRVIASGPRAGTVPRRGSHACLRSDRVRAGPGSHARAQLRVAAAAAWFHRDRRHRGHHRAPRPEPVRRRDQAPRHRHRRVAGPADLRGCRRTRARRAGHGPCPARRRPSSGVG